MVCIFKSLGFDFALFTTVALGNGVNPTKFNKLLSKYSVLKMCKSLDLIRV